MLNISDIYDTQLIWFGLSGFGGGRQEQDTVKVRLSNINYEQKPGTLLTFNTE